MNKQDNRNKLYFGLGTIGRDMFYAFEANTLLHFLTYVLDLPVWVFAAASMILSVMRIFDAFNDPITGLLIDNIRSPWGKFKPAILVGGVLSAIFSVLLFANIGTGWGFVIIFGIAYLLWDITYGINDIGYWTLLPAMSSDQKQREKTGAFARICANIGMYIVMVAWQPVTTALGNTQEVWFWCAVVIAAVYLLGLLFPLLGVKEKRVAPEQQESTSVKQMVNALVKNDQLMWTTLAMGLFMIGYCTTVNFAVTYMKYIFGDEGMYVVLVAVVGVSQLGTLAVYPAVAAKMNRRQLYTLGTALVLVGYVVFFLADTSLALIAIGAVLGERTSRELVRTGSDTARVTALFTDLSSWAAQQLTALDCPPDEDGNVLIGVPGIFHEKEQEAARGFGFPEFRRLTNNEIPLEENERNTYEDFGYWCRQIPRT